MADDHDKKDVNFGQTFETGGRIAKKAKVNGRESKAHIGAYLDPGFRRSLRMVQAQTDKDIQELLAEALNDLFRKYNVIIIASKT